MNRPLSRSKARVLGVDGCPGGWVGVAPDPDRARVYAAPTLAAVIEAASVDGAPSVVGVDIPIGLADHGWRGADLEAKRLLGSRGSSLFMTPVRQALEIDDYAEAVAVNRARTHGAGFSRQAFGLQAKIREVDAFWPTYTPRPLLEVHPELCFTMMAGGTPMTHGKKTWAGAVQRLGRLAEQGIVLGAELGPDTGRAGVDDVLDAAAAAWTARRYAAGVAVSLPVEAELFSDGIPCAIYY